MTPMNHEMENMIVKSRKPQARPVKRMKLNEPKRSYCNLTKTQFDTLFGAVGLCSVCGGNIIDHPGKHEIFVDDFDDEDYEDDDPAGENSEGDEIESSEEERQHGDRLMTEDLNFVDGVEPLLSKKQKEIYAKIKPRFKEALTPTVSHDRNKIINDAVITQHMTDLLTSQNDNEHNRDQSRSNDNTSRSNNESPHIVDISPAGGLLS